MCIYMYMTINSSITTEHSAKSVSKTAFKEALKSTAYLIPSFRALCCGWGVYMRGKMHTGFWWGSLVERNTLKHYT